MRLFAQGDNNGVHPSGCEGTQSSGLLSDDWLVVGDQEPPLGSHLVTPRCGYLHHGIYVGARKVVHYPGRTPGLRGGAVEEVPFAHFARGRRVLVRPEAPSGFDVREVVCRARSRVGENRYRLLSNNCEHFCEWCLRGTARSFQVEAWLTRPRLSLLAIFYPIVRDYRFPTFPHPPREVSCGGSVPPRSFSWGDDS
jgi:hypothetical protein